jgi:hypothetical protein
MPIRVVAGILAMAVISATNSHGAVITFEFQGTLTSVPTELSGTFAVGQPFTESITFESTTPDSEPGNSAHSSFSNAILTWTIQVGSESFAAPTVAPFNFITVADGPVVDEFQFTALFGLTGPTINGFAPATLNQDFVDVGGTALSSDALPTTIDLSAWPDNRFLDIGFDNPLVPGRIFLRGRVESGGVVANAVPEPASLTFLGWGCFAFISYGYRLLGRKSGTKATYQQVETAVRH